MLHQKQQSLAFGGVVVAVEYTATPQTSGNYSTSIDVAKLIFAEGNYVVEAQYLDYTATKTFTVIDPLDLKDGAIIFSGILFTFSITILNFRASGFSITVN